MVQRQGKGMRFDGPNRLRFTGQHGEPEERFQAASRLLAALESCLAQD
jgi:hypothetical protein